MPPSLLFDISSIDLNNVIADQEAIRQCNPQRGDMEQLNGVVYADGSLGRIVAYKDVRPDEFWVAGHIPGRPLFPGVLMIEAAAQTCGYFTRKYVGWTGFIGFGGADEIRFRTPVVPGDRIYFLAQQIWARHKRICSKVQGLVKGNIVFEAAITGAQF